MVKTYLSTRFSGGAYRIIDGKLSNIEIPSFGAQYDIMAFPGDGAQVVAVGRDASIYKSNDSGDNWTVAVGDYTELDNKTAFFEVWVVNNLVSYVVGENGAVVKSIDGGVTYNQTTGNLGIEGDLAVQSVHFIDELVGIIRVSNKLNQETYALKTTDGGDNWSFLNTGSGYVFDNTEGAGTDLNKWSYGGVHLSEDESTLHVLTRTGLYRSTDSGVNFTLAVSFFSTGPYGQHLTWINDNELWATGASTTLWRTTDAGATWIEVLSPGNPSGSMQAAHFVNPTFGYLAFNVGGNSRYLVFTEDGGATEASTIPYGSAVVTAVWTVITNPCYELIDCAGLSEPIQTGTDLSEHVGQVITLADETNHEIKGCWLVTESEDCYDVVDVAVYKCHDTCEDCLPAPLPPRIPCPRPVDPGYDTGLCNSEIVEDVKCTYADLMYQKMMSRRYRIEYCCQSDEEDAFIENEKISMLLMTAEEPEFIECVRWNINCESAAARVTIDYVDCFGNRVNYISNVGEAGLCVAFCGSKDFTPIAENIPYDYPGAPVPPPGLNGTITQLRDCYPGDVFYSSADTIEPQACEQWCVDAKGIGSGTIEYTGCDGVFATESFDWLTLDPRPSVCICILPGTDIIVKGDASYNLVEQDCSC